MTTKSILRIVPTLQTLALVKHNAKLVSKKKVSSNDLVKVGVGTIVGAALIKESAEFIESI